MFTFSLTGEMIFFPYCSYSSLTNLTYKRQTTVTFAYLCPQRKIEFPASHIMAPTRKIDCLLFFEESECKVKGMTFLKGGGGGGRERKNEGCCFYKTEDVFRCNLKYYFSMPLQPRFPQTAIFHRDKNLLKLRYLRNR